jgi:hypothetical protein
MCLGNGEAYPQRVAAESFEEAYLNCGRNQAAGRWLAFLLFPARCALRSSPAVRRILTTRDVFTIRIALLSFGASGIWVTVGVGHVAEAEVV